jgi:hypothetical protein
MQGYLSIEAGAFGIAGILASCRKHRLVDLPVIARIEYTRDGKKQVRQARVSCRLNPEGRVVAFR